MSDFARTAMACGGSDDATEDDTNDDEDETDDSDESMMTEVLDLLLDECDDDVGIDRIDDDDDEDAFAQEAFAAVESAAWFEDA